MRIIDCDDSNSEIIFEDSIGVKLHYFEKRLSGVRKPYAFMRMKDGVLHDAHVDDTELNEYMFDKTFSESNSTLGSINFSPGLVLAKNSLVMELVAKHSFVSCITFKLTKRNGTVYLVLYNPVFSSYYEVLFRHGSHTILRITI